MPFSVVCWTALWLFGAMHCPLEASGVLANDFCCSAVPAPLDGSGEPAKSGCSYEESDRWLTSRAGETTPGPVTIAKSGSPPSPPPPVISAIVPIQPGDTTSFLPQSWHFYWRAASPPRAPSFLA